ncbi:MAG: aminotransferase class V-fold PLP-dependent enzyme [Bifidobacteriaceae bacterium]|jgi:O-acetylhomoserine (thiol)-lyase|nr:aminotransferase class V-fold PLP-dependent enzyme [Bifidobacteriaceae bacterium]
MSTDQPEYGFETRQIHAGQTPDPITGSRALPIYQTTAYVFKDAKQAADRFALTDLGPIYTRLTNPTQEVVENRIASLEGGVGALLTSSGQAAITLAILNIAGQGDHIVASASLYGGTHNLFGHTLQALGIEATFLDHPEDIEEWRAAIKPNTKALYGEVISNPKNDVLDIEPIAKLAHANGIPLIVDNTVPTPYLCRPIEWGADIVIHSATKFLGGHGTAVAGAIVDSGKFDYTASGKFPGFTTPDASYNGLVYGRDLGEGGALGANLSYILKARAQLLRDLGPCISPFNAFLIEQGIETLSLRMERHVSNAQKVAEYLESRPEVNSVAYAGLESSPWHQLQLKYTPLGASAVPAFDIKGGAKAGQAFASALKLHSLLANLGDVHSLVCHPASTTHAQLSPAELEAAGVTPGLIRLAVGLESIDDIISDLDLGFAAAKAAA